MLAVACLGGRILSLAGAKCTHVMLVTFFVVLCVGCSCFLTHVVRAVRLSRLPAGHVTFWLLDWHPARNGIGAVDLRAQMLVATSSVEYLRIEARRSLNLQLESDLRGVLSRGMCARMEGDGSICSGGRVDSMVRSRNQFDLRLLASSWDVSTCAGEVLFASLPCAWLGWFGLDWRSFVDRLRNGGTGLGRAVQWFLALCRHGGGLGEFPRLL